MVSFDLSVLFQRRYMDIFGVPVAEAVSVIKTRLEEDDTLHERTKLNFEDIVDILDLVLSTPGSAPSTSCIMNVSAKKKKTYGAAMGSPVSPIVIFIWNILNNSR